MAHDRVYEHTKTLIPCITWKHTSNKKKKKARWPCGYNYDYVERVIPNQIRKSADHNSGLRPKPAAPACLPKLIYYSNCLIVSWVRNHEQISSFFVNINCVLTVNVLGRSRIERKKLDEHTKLHKKLSRLKLHCFYIYVLYGIYFNGVMDAPWQLPLNVLIKA